MPASAWPHRRPARWWALFALLVALPAIALAAAGVRAISADRIARANRLQQQASSTARLADAALSASFGRAIDAAFASQGTPGVTPFERDSRGAVLFSEDRVYAAAFGVVPANLSPSSRATTGGSVFTDIPEEVVAAVSSGRQGVVRAALARLRAGSWWLHLDQRRAYDRMLTDLAGESPDIAPDGRLNELDRLRAFISAQPITSGSGAASDRLDKGLMLAAWTSEEGAFPARGIVLDTGQTKALLSEALDDLVRGQGFAAELVDRNGSAAWRSEELSPVVMPDTRLTAVSGWTLRLSSTAAPPAASWQTYGLVVLPLVVLAFGLVAMTRVMKQGMDLARRQAEFTAAVTHEFKSPITSLRLVMERLRDGRLQTGPALADYHRAIERETDRLDTLVTRLLDVQAIQQGRAQLDREPTQIEPLLRSAVERVQRHADAKQIGVQIQAGEDMPDLAVDPVRVTDAVSNLVENAINYSPAGTLVSVKARRVGGHVEVSVADEGTGIHKDDLPHVFEPYYRGRLGDRESVRGTGLGLALVQATAIAHGGNVEVRSQPGHGSQFTLTLPITEGA